MQKNHKSLDKIDKQILRELQNDGRMSNVELSRRVNLSPTPCLERVRRLEQQGFITGYMALLDPRKLNQSLVVFVEITLDRTTPDVFDVFASAIRKLTEIGECHMVARWFQLSEETSGCRYVCPIANSLNAFLPYRAPVKLITYVGNGKN